MTADTRMSVHLLGVGAINLKFLKNLITVVMLGTWCPVTSYALDPFVVGSGGGGQYSWKIQFAEGSSDLYGFTTSVGLIAPVLGKWQEGLSVATLTRGAGESFILRHPSNSTGVDLGSGYFMIAGGDFDGAGKAGVAMAQRSRSGFGITWRIISDPLNSNAAYTVNGLGGPGDIPFYFRGSEGRDLLSVLRVSGKGLYRQLLTVDVLSGRRQIVRLSDPVRGVVKVAGIRLSNGAGGVFIQTFEDYRIYSASGEFLVWGNTDNYARGTIAVGDYLSDDGEEVAVLNADTGEVSVLNPFSENRRVLRVGSGTGLHDSSTGLVLNGVR
jgi:hypothetical protein